MKIDYGETDSFGLSFTMKDLLSFNFFASIQLLAFYSSTLLLIKAIML